jgi:hypothetical protein
MDDDDRLYFRGTARTVKRKKKTPLSKGPNWARIFAVLVFLWVVWHLMHRNVR